MDSGKSFPNKSHSFKSRLFLPVLFLSIFVTWMFTVFFSTLLLDIANSFHVSIGTASQALTVARFAGLFSGLAMGLLTVRINHKSLFVSGIAIYGFGILGSGLAKFYRINGFSGLSGNGFCNSWHYVVDFNRRRCTFTKKRAGQ